MCVCVCVCVRACVRTCVRVCVRVCVCVCVCCEMSCSLLERTYQCLNYALAIFYILIYTGDNITHTATHFKSSIGLQAIAHKSVLCERVREIKVMRRQHNYLHLQAPY